MLAAASRAKEVLGDRVEVIADFIRRQINPDGGIRGRGGKSDLYYTVFGVEALLALGADVPKEQILGYLERFGDGKHLDLVHLACLLRCGANLSQKQPEEETCRSIIERAGQYLAEQPNVYNCFLALNIYQDLTRDIQNSGVILDIIKSLQRSDYGYTNDWRIESSSTPVTAAAVTILHNLNEPVSSSSIDWLLCRVHSKGGFVAMSGLPDADLLSTATTLHALAITGVRLDDIKEQCLEFIDSLWTNQGGFCGYRADKVPDCEYTYYGLLSHGHLNG
jgi:prenyltransferase beta subunit